MAFDIDFYIFFCYLIATRSPPGQVEVHPEGGPGGSRRGSWRPTWVQKGGLGGSRRGSRSPTWLQNRCKSSSRTRWVLVLKVKAPRTPSFSAIASYLGAMLGFKIEAKPIKKQVLKGKLSGITFLIDFCSQHGPKNHPKTHAKEDPKTRTLEVGAK